MINELENDNLLKLNINKDYSVISNIEDILLDNNNQDIESNEKNIIKCFLSNNNINKISKKEKCLYILEIISKFKLNLKYNCTNEYFNKFIANKLIDDASCRLVSNFKENMLRDYIDEFLKRIYKYKESIERFPKFSKYYKNYLRFFCKPTFKDFRINKIIDRNGEKKAEIYYKNNYQGGKSQDNDENNGFAKSSSIEENINKENNEKNKNDIENINNLTQLFNESIKEKIENVTIMTTINSSLNNTINLKIVNEKIEVFSQNKCDKSNDTTLHDIIDIIKNKKKKTEKFKIKENNISKIKKQSIQQKKEKNDNINDKKVFNNNDRDLKIKNNFNNFLTNSKNNFITKLNKRINMKSLNKNIEDKIKKIIQNEQNFKNDVKKNNQKGLNLDISSPLEIKNNDLFILKNSSNNSNKHNPKKSRNNNIGFLYKQTYTNYNNYNNNICLNNNKINSTSLHKNNKNIYFPNNLYSSINNIQFNNYNNKINNIFNNSNKTNNNSKYYITNSSLDNKAGSMKMLESYTGFNNRNEIKNKNKIKYAKDNLIYIK